MHTHRLLKKISVMCAGALLLACADVARQPGASQGLLEVGVRHRRQPAPFS